MDLLQQSAVQWLHNISSPDLLQDLVPPDIELTVVDEHFRAVAADIYLLDA